MTTVVVAPMNEEMAGLRRRLIGPETAPPALGELPWAVHGRLAGRPVILAVTGDGEAHARRGIETVLAGVPVTRLIAVGVAGALSPDLAAETVVAARRVVREGGAPLLAEEEIARQAAACGARPGVAVTSSRLVTTPAAKAELYRRWAAPLPCQPPPPMVVDLESAVYAAAAERAGVPWLVLRAVSDSSFEEIPPFLEACRDPGGGVRRAAVVRYALTHPRVVPGLLRLARRVRRCAEALAVCVERLVAGL